MLVDQKTQNIAEQQRVIEAARAVCNGVERSVSVRFPQCTRGFEKSSVVDFVDTSV